MNSLVNLIKKPQSAEGTLMGKLEEVLSQSVSTMHELKPMMASMESLSESQVDALSTACENWESAYKRIASELSIEGLRETQIQAATAITAALSNIKSFMSTKVEVAAPANMDSLTTFVGMEGISDGFSTRAGMGSMSLEAYDEKEIRETVLNTVFYNMQVGRQNEFGEAFFPTVVIDNNNVGVEVKVRLIQVYDEIKHSVRGSVAEFEDRNIIKALVDGTILKNDGTRIFPIFRTGQNEDAFVPSTFIAHRVIKHEGEDIDTAPLAIGKTIDILGLSQTDALLANGTMDMTDTVDPAFSLDAIYLQIDDKSPSTKTDKIRIPVRQLAGSNFVMSVQDMHRLERLTFNTDGIMLNKQTKDVANSALQALAGIATDDLIVFIGVSMYGELNTRDGKLVVHAPEVRLFRVIDGATGQDIALTDSRVTPIATAIKTAKVVGYDVYGFRTNLNRRQRGQLLDNNYYRQIWAVPLRAPITVLHPVSAGDQNDNSDLASLVSATFIRTSNEAVRTLVQTADMLKAHVDNRIARPVSKHTHASALFGVSRFLIDPTFYEREVDIATSVNSLTSFEQAQDVAACLVNHIRDVAYHLYRDSNYQAAIDAQVTGMSGNPTVIVGTDPMTARYLMINGENRLVGPDFKYHVVRSVDNLVMNKIFIAFGYPEQTNGVLNPMHFGNMLWSPEMVLKMPMTINGQVSRELTVQPRFRHIVNVPVMGVLHVKNLPVSLINKTILWQTQKP